MTAGSGSSELWLVTNFAGTQAGTKNNPFAARDSIEFDALMREHAHIEELAVHLNDGIFQTAGTREWDDTNDVQLNPGFRAGRRWTFDTETGATLQWDVDAVPDERVTDTPIKLIQSTEARFDARLNLHTPEEVWNLSPRGQAVRNLNIDLQFSRAVDRWRAKGKTLRIGAVALAGHQAAIERIHLTNWGAWGYEGFPFHIQAAYGAYDRNLIAQLDPATHICDADLPDEECSHITDCTADGYYEGTNDQVTVRLIAGSIGERTPGQWVQTPRAYFYMTGNRTIATGSNMVQAHSAMNSLRGKVTKNYSECQVSYYEDTYAGRGVEIDDNDHIGYHGVQLLLSPGGVCPEQYSREGYTIGGRNRFNTNGPNVKLDTLGPATDRRFIRNISVDGRLSLENNGATNVTRTGLAPIIKPPPRTSHCPW